jgi:hypothetical protein
MGGPQAQSVDSPQAVTDEAVRLLDGVEVHLAGVRLARDVVPGVGPRRFLHSGPPITLDELPGPMRGAIAGALILEGEAAGAAEAEAIIAAGEVELSPCHDAGGVGAMAGIVSPSTAVAVVESPAGERFSPLNEGLGRVLRMGAYDDDVIAQLRWLRDVAAPALDAAIQASEPIELIGLVAEALRRGDECHNRNVALSALLITRLAPALARTGRDPEDVARTLEYARDNPHFALPFGIGAGKALTDAAHGVAGSPIVTAMAGNGRRIGIRVSGLGDRWFTAPAPLGRARFFKGFSAGDATPAMGDSMIAEVAGFGAFAITAAPAITSFIGGTVAEGRDLVDQMRTICAGTSSRLLIPPDDYRGTPLGIDVHRVADTGIAPQVDNGMAHRDAGVGQVGAGITRFPVEPFAEASAALRAMGAAA